jgi:hypothetical protein
MKHVYNERASSTGCHAQNINLSSCSFGGFTVKDVGPSQTFQGIKLFVFAIVHESYRARRSSTQNAGVVKVFGSDGTKLQRGFGAVLAFGGTFANPIDGRRGGAALLQELFGSGLENVGGFRGGFGGIGQECAHVVVVIVGDDGEGGGGGGGGGGLNR